MLKMIMVLFFRRTCFVKHICFTYIFITYIFIYVIFLKIANVAKILFRAGHVVLFCIYGVGEQADPHWEANRKQK